MAVRDMDDETLEALSGEVLPERVLMSVLIPSPVRGQRTEVFYACQTTHYYGTPGLLGTGLLAQEARDTTTCIPAVVHTY
ncbi:hypothetical protein [Actinomadura sp. 6N118]|uniref:hypothetical protein n=1 Tax=Actinomadura sp. 6N118 TaxID=3375151 RepID=UPI0037A0EAD6